MRLHLREEIYRYEKSDAAYLESMGRLDPKSTRSLGHYVEQAKKEHRQRRVLDERNIASADVVIDLASLLGGLVPARGARRRSLVVPKQST